MKQRFWFFVIVLALSAPAVAAEQAPHAGGVAPPQLANPAQGILNDNQDQPIQIDAATLEVRDKEKMATFAGDVQVVQGDTTIKCQKLVVFYGPEPGAAANASQAKRQQQQPQQPQAPQPQAQQPQAQQRSPHQVKGTLYLLLAEPLCLCCALVRGKRCQIHNRQQHLRSRADRLHRMTLVQRNPHT